MKIGIVHSVDRFDIVVVLRCNNTLLFDRSKARGYPEEKIRVSIVILYRQQ